MASCVETLEGKLGNSKLKKKKGKQEKQGYTWCTVAYCRLSIIDKIPSAIVAPDEKWSLLSEQSRACCGHWIQKVRDENGRQKERRKNDERLFFHGRLFDGITFKGKRTISVLWKIVELDVMQLLQQVYEQQITKKGESGRQFGRKKKRIKKIINYQPEEL